MNTVARWWAGVKPVVFRGVEAGLDQPLTPQHRLLVSVLEIVRIEEHVGPPLRLWTGRPKLDRGPMARAFVAKAVYNDPTTSAFVQRLATDTNLCRICGWDGSWDTPSEATFFRAFAQFAEQGLCDEVHETLVTRHVQDAGSGRRRNRRSLRGDESRGVRRRARSSAGMAG